MVKFLTLMNPPRNKRMKTRRLRSGRFTSRKVTTASVPRRARRIRRVSTRRNPPKMTTAMRAKISRAVKAANRRRGVSAPRSARRSSVAVARRSNLPSPAMRAKISAGVRRANARRRGGISRFTGGRSFGKGLLGSILSPTTIGLASGAITASIGTGMILRNFGSRLPMASSPYGRIGYQLLIPATVALFLRKKYRNFSEGLVVGGLVMATAELIRFMKLGSSAPTVPTLAPVGEFYDATQGIQDMGVAGELGVRSFSAYPQTVQEVQGASNGAFPDGAW